MTPGQIAFLERIVWLVAFSFMVAAAAAFDWRAGLFLAGVLLALSSLDIASWRRS